MRDFKNEQEVYDLFTKSKRKIVIFEGAVYDIDEYAATHPGGAEILEPYYGKCIDEPFEDNGHTNAARLIFRELEKLGYLKGDGTKEGSKSPTGLDGTELRCKL